MTTNINLRLAGSITRIATCAAVALTVLAMPQQPLPHPARSPPMACFRPVKP